MKFQGEFGAFEGTCPYHRGTVSNPRCRITKSVPSGEELDKTLRWVKTWLLAGASPAVKYKTEHARVSMPSVPYEEDQLEERLQALAPPPEWDDVLPEAALRAIAEDEESCNESSSD